MSMYEDRKKLIQEEGGKKRKKKLLLMFAKGQTGCQHFFIDKSHY